MQKTNPSDQINCVEIAPFYRCSLTIRFWTALSKNSISMIRNEYKCPEKWNPLLANTSDHSKYDMLADHRKCGIYIVTQAESVF